jgi:DNA (cytosine-5)-methyltransferase 1
MKTTATLFSGFEGVGIGATAAGYTHLWGVEYDADIAAVAERNGFPTIVSDVCNVDYSTLERPYHLHASPVCKNASVAKVDGEESPVDIETANAVCRAIVTLRPTLFTLENVRGYIHFQAFRNIVAMLRQCGYQMTQDVLNAANYGVPQTRERLILVARNDGIKPRMPEHTHARADLLGTMFETRLPWVGWYESIADLIDGLPDAEFANWQKKRLPSLAIAGTTLVTGMANTSRDATLLEADQPSATVITNWCHRPSHMPFGFLVNESSTMEVHQSFEPVATQVASPSRGLKAFVLAEGGFDGGLVKRESDSPIFTMTSNQNQQHIKAAVSGRVVKMTPRCLARFQSFPDSYALPESARLATTGIGNAVPPLLMQLVMEAQG